MKHIYLIINTTVSAICSFCSIRIRFKASYDAAQEIRNGKIDRAEGVNLVKLYDTEFPKKYFKDFLNYISISENEFHIIVNKFRSPHLWGKDSSGDWKLRKNVFKNGLDD